MFKVAELGSVLSKDALKALVPELRVDLVNAQYDLRSRPFSVLILLMGDDLPGLSEVVARLHEWMDARYIRTEAFDRPTPGESERPLPWRYWRALPAHGEVGIFVGAWGAGAIRRRLFEDWTEAEFHERLASIRRFERALADDGTLILKFWLHLPRDAHAKRLKRVTKGEYTGVPLSRADSAIFERYEELMPLAAAMIEKTSTDASPWQLVESTDERYRDAMIAKAIRHALSGRLEQTDGHTGSRAVQTIPQDSGMLDSIDLSQSLMRDEYKARLGEGQKRLGELWNAVRKSEKACVCVFEGWDAAGKGGCIRRIIRSVSAFDYRLVPIAAPTDEEKARHYLWRFWRRLPRAGRMVIFDRSWYGRVLVERVEGFAREDEWRRAYKEINEFEAQLTHHGWPVAKFWLHIDQDEQLRRFEAREQTAYKKYKITDEDYRNRDKWNAYEHAANEMVERTSTAGAPWTLVPANDKRYARVMVVETLCDALERTLASSV